MSEGVVEERVGGSCRGFVSRAEGLHSGCNFFVQVIFVNLDGGAESGGKAPIVFERDFLVHQSGDASARRIVCVEKIFEK